MLNCVNDKPEQGNPTPYTKGIETCIRSVLTISMLWEEVILGTGQPQDSGQMAKVGSDSTERSFQCN